MQVLVPLDGVEEVGVRRVVVAQTSVGAVIQHLAPRGLGPLSRDLVDVTAAAVVGGLTQFRHFVSLERVF